MTIKEYVLKQLQGYNAKLKPWVEGKISAAVAALKAALKLEDITDVTATADEVNYLSGVKSNVQNQIDNILVDANLTGTPTAPTAQKGTNTTQVATTAFVKEAVDAAVLEGVGSIDLSQYPNAVPVYNSESKKIEFYHDSTKIYELDATAFIKDGMVNTVSIADGKTDGSNNGKKVLLITFNTDAGKEDIEIPLDGIFDASNYYNKTEADSTFVKNSDWESKTEDFLTEDDLEGYLKESDLVDISEAEFTAMFAEA